MGGFFRMESGRVKAHVNPDLEVLPENYYDPDQMKCVKDFLQFYSFPGPLLCFTCRRCEQLRICHASRRKRPCRAGDMFRAEVVCAPLCFSLQSYE